MTRVRHCGKSNRAGRRKYRRHRQHQPLLQRSHRLPKVQQVRPFLWAAQHRHRHPSARPQQLTVKCPHGANGESAPVRAVVGYGCDSAMLSSLHVTGDVHVRHLSSGARAAQHRARRPWTSACSSGVLGPHAQSHAGAVCNRGERSSSGKLAVTHESALFVATGCVTRCLVRCPRLRLLFAYMRTRAAVKPLWRPLRRRQHHSCPHRPPYLDVQLLRPFGANGVRVRHVVVRVCNADSVS